MRACTLSPDTLSIVNLHEEKPIGNWLVKTPRILLTVPAILDSVRCHVVFLDVIATRSKSNENEREGSTRLGAHQYIRAFQRSITITTPNLKTQSINTADW